MDKKNKYGFDENLAKLFIKHVTNDQRMTLKLMSFLYPENPNYKFWKCDSGHFSSIINDTCPHCKSEINKFVKPHVVEQYKSDKHKEIVDSLNYLKSKPNKTKQDRESIHTLEVILKNFS